MLLLASRSVSYRLLTLSLVGSLALTACSSQPKAAPAADQLSATDEQIFIGDTIEKNYDPNVIMKRAESFFEKEDYPEAIIEYQHFLDLHRVHTLAPYAQFKLAESHYKLFRSIDRDPNPIYQALETYQKLLKDYPGSRYELEAVEKIRSCQNLLAQAAFFVGRFYYRREAYLAAAHRFEAILDTYPDQDVAPEALFYLALTYKELGAKAWAREKLALLAERYPNNKHQKESQRLIAQLNRALEQEAVAVVRADEEEGATTSVDGPAPPRLRSGATASFQSQRDGETADAGFLCRLGLWC